MSNVGNKIAESGTSQTSRGFLSKFMGNNPKVATGLARAGVVGTAAASGNPPKTQPNTQNSGSTADLASALTSGAGTSTASQPDTPFNSARIQAAIVQDIAENGGKHVAALVSLYNAFGKPSASSSQLSTSQQKEVTAGSSAIALLKQYGDQIDQLAKGSSGNVASGLFANLMGKYDPFASQADKNAHALQSSKRDVAIQLATAISGGQKPQISSINQIEEGLPSINDSPQLRQDKISALVDRMQKTLQIYATPVDRLAATALAGGQ